MIELMPVISTMESITRDQVVTQQESLMLLVMMIMLLAAIDDMEV